jgi:hypothetical protein
MYNQTGKIGNELDSDRFNFNQFKFYEMDSILGGQTGPKSNQNYLYLNSFYPSSLLKSYSDRLPGKSCSPLLPSKAMNQIICALHWAIIIRTSGPCHVSLLITSDLFNEIGPAERTG